MLLYQLLFYLFSALGMQLLILLFFIQDHYDALDPSSRWTWLDRILFLSLISLYIIIHVIMGIWHWRVPLAKQRSMKILDDRYKQMVEKTKSLSK